MIVISVIAVLAALVLPHYTKASDTARGNVLLAELNSVRKQMMSYALDHNENYPTLIQLWSNLTDQTDVEGNTGTEYGPYILKAPRNPYTGGSTCAADNSADWEYDETTGTIRGVVPAAFIAEMNMSSADVVAAP